MKYFNFNFKNNENKNQVNKKKLNYNNIQYQKIYEHLLPLDQVIQQLNTNINLTHPYLSIGLLKEQRFSKRLIYSTNKFSQFNSPNLISQYFQYLFSIFNFPLFILGLICLFLIIPNPIYLIPNLSLGLALIGAALINSGIDLVQIRKSWNILETCRDLLPEVCYLVNNGNILQVPVDDLVPGDLVILKQGDFIPADILIFHSNQFKVDNSSLTGQNELQSRGISNVRENIFEANNLAFKGTQVSVGEAYGIVLRTGDQTVLGQILLLVRNKDDTKSQLYNEMATFIKRVYIMDVLNVIIFFAIVLIKSSSVNDAVLFSTGLILTWVPEGLPATIAIILSLAARSMAKQNLLIKDFRGVETVGAISLLIMDSTCGISRDNLFVTWIYSMGNHHSILLNKPKLNSYHWNSLCGQLLKLNFIFNTKVTIYFNKIKNTKPTILGEPIEIGLLDYAYDNFEDYIKLEKRFKIVYRIPNQSNRKYHISIIKDKVEGDCILLVKGQVQRILESCNKLWLNNEIASLTEELKIEIETAYKILAKKGFKVVAFASLNLDKDKYSDDYVFDFKSKNYPQNNYIFTGLVGLEDKPKHGVREAIGQLRTAGIKVIMVTSEDEISSEAIARKTNLMTHDTPERLSEKTGRPLDKITSDEYSATVVKGHEISGWTDECWDEVLLKDEIIFAKIHTEHKLDIVKRAQNMGHTVAMIGDSVNDIPALKQCDLPIALKKSNSALCQEIAKVILLDDHLNSLVKCIEEGRKTFINIKKCIKLTCTHTFPEVISQSLPALIPIPSAMTTILTVVVDLGFDLITSLSYAWDYADSYNGLMKLEPRSKVTFENVKMLRSYQKQLPIKGSNISKINYISHVFNNIKYHFRQYTISHLNEHLIDWELLSWATIEVGLYETLVSFMSFFYIYHKAGLPLNLLVKAVSEGAFNIGSKGYFNPMTNELITYDQLIELNAQGQSAYLLSLMILQAFNLFAIKGHLRPPFGKYIFQNVWNFITIFLGIFIGCIIIYIPAFNIIFGTSHKLELDFIWFPFSAGWILLIYATFRVWFVQKSGLLKYSTTVGGLQMYPTTRTIAGIEL